MEIERETLKEALEAAAENHHEYESNLLGGMHDEAWADWYGAFLMGRLPDLKNPSELIQMLQMAADMHEREVNQSMPWADFYADHIIHRLSLEE